MNNNNNNNNSSSRSCNQSAERQGESPWEGDFAGTDEETEYDHLSTDKSYFMPPTPKPEARAWNQNAKPYHLLAMNVQISSVPEQRCLSVLRDDDDDDA